MAEIGVSYNGTWSKRGYTANFEIGFVISVDTGEIFDHDFEPKLCMECLSAKRDLREDTNEFGIWFAGHNDKCSQGHITLAPVDQRNVALLRRSGDVRVSMVSNTNS